MGGYITILHFTDHAAASLVPIFTFADAILARSTCSGHASGVKLVGDFEERVLITHACAVERNILDPVQLKVREGILKTRLGEVRWNPSIMRERGRECEKQCETRPIGTLLRTPTR